MLTRLPDHARETPQGREAESILRSCVHCGFCNATCPTYGLLGDELDGPRGRIYLIKDMLEDGAAGEVTRRHLDRCLTCLACETTCPSGVRYGRLLDIGREQLEKNLPRPWKERVLRWGLRHVTTRPRLLRRLLPLAPLLPRRLAAPLRRHRPATAWPGPGGQRRLILLEGCAQSALRPDLNALTARLLHRLGYTVIRVREVRCCGALSHHLAAGEEARRLMRANVDAWLPLLEDGAEAIVSNASACSLMLRDYAHHLSDDPAYRDKAAQISRRSRDITEVLAQADLSRLRPAHVRRPIAFHAPCTLQHGLRLGELTRDILRRCGHELLPVTDEHLCCGAAGAYHILQPHLARQLRNGKLAALQAANPACIATANIGCLLHLEEDAKVPVRHWLELLGSGEV